MAIDEKERIIQWLSQKFFDTITGYIASRDDTVLDEFNALLIEMTKGQKAGRDFPTFSLAQMVELTSRLGIKLATVIYDDKDPDNLRGPIDPQIFQKAWVRAGKPLTLDQLEANTSHTPIRVITYKGQTLYRLEFVAETAAMLVSMNPHRSHPKNAIAKAESLFDALAETANAWNHDDLIDDLITQSIE
jgi:hypothetical protein